MKKILIINILFTVIVFIILELLANHLYLKHYDDILSSKYKFFMPYSKPIEFDAVYYAKTNFKVYNKNYTGKPNAFVGCSYTDGFGIPEKETFVYKIAKLTKRKTYSFGVSATGLQFVYWQVENKTIPTDSKYVIYTFIFDHLRRIHQFQSEVLATNIDLRYKNVNGNLIQIKSHLNFINSLFFIKIIQEYLETKAYEKEKKDFALFRIYMKNLMEIFQKNYPNSKFVFVEYEEDTNPDHRLPIEIRKYINDLGYIYIDLEEATGVKIGSKEYKIKGEGAHPSEYASTIVANSIYKNFK